MKSARISGLFVVLTAAFLVLSACGESDPTVAPPTTQPTNPPAQATTVAVQTTQVAPTTAAATAANVTTVPASATASTAGGSNRMLELLGLIPDNPDNLKTLVFNDYAALRKIYGVPSDQTFLQFTGSTQGSGGKFLSVARHLYAARATPLNYAAQDLPGTLGYDILQIDQDAEAGQPPATLSLVWGRFNPDLIGQRFTAVKAEKGKSGQFSTYNLGEKLELTNPIKRQFISAFNFLAVAEAGNMLVSSGRPEPVEAALRLAAGNNIPQPVTANPAVRALLEVFGRPQAIFMSNQYGPPAGLLDLNKLPEEQKKTLQDFINLKLPPALLGGYAFYEDQPEQGYYRLANYYQSPEAAKSALPILEKILREGVSTRVKRPYSDYFTVQSAEVKDRVAIYRLQLKAPTTRMLDFVASRDLPLFWS